MCKTIFFKPGKACDLTLLCCSRERQAINPNYARLQFQLSRCLSLGGNLVLWRRWNRKTDNLPWDRQETRILLAEKYFSIREKNSVIRNPHTWMKLSHWVLGISPLSLPFSCFGSILMHSLPNLAVEKRGYRESCWACVHGWQRCEMTVTKEDAH